MKYGVFWKNNQVRSEVCPFDFNSIELAWAGCDMCCMAPRSYYEVLPLTTPTVLAEYERDVYPG